MSVWAKVKDYSGPGQYYFTTEEHYNGQTSYFLSRILKKGEYVSEDIYMTKLEGSDIFYETVDEYSNLDELINDWQLRLRHSSSNSNIWGIQVNLYYSKV